MNARLARTVLFSDDKIATFINQNFEPVWISLRPVPTVRVDFGNGHIINRTLQGNMVTMACAADGTILDVMPGLYQPDVYLKNLEQFKILASRAARNDGAVFLSTYHHDQEQALMRHRMPSVLRVRHPDAGHDAVELIASNKTIKQTPSPSDLWVENPDIQVPAQVRAWDALWAETTYNETIRRQAIHKVLSDSAPTSLSEFTHNIYRDVLHCDLDDPYLGLGPYFFAAYPFD